MPEPLALLTLATYTLTTLVPDTGGPIWLADEDLDIL